MRRALAITLALFALLLLLARLRSAPPSPVPASAPADHFSATRARQVQRALVGDGATRFVGTPGNARGRAVIVAELEKAGWKVETQEAWSCTYHGTCAPIVNVVAQLFGREPSLPGVLLTAHYDSVLVSPGASDDGLGVSALLETARALAAGTKPRRTIVAVFTDGEEAGLLGADAFARGHPLASSVRATVNVDSRGSRGPSQMFETSRGNAWLLALVAGHVDRPVTTSLYYEVYKRMPNDTDFSITKTIASGVNFANIVGIEHYHAPADSLETSDPGTLQHHGDNALAMARAFAESDLRGAIEAPGDAVWFDVLAFGIVRWPERWSMLLALVALSLLVGQTIRARVFERGLLVFVASFAAGLAATVAVGFGLVALGALPAPVTVQPLPALVALHASALAGVCGIALLFARRASPRALWSGTWIAWALLGAVVARVAPGASYLFVVPALVAAVSAWGPFALACAAPAVTAAIVVLPLALGLYDALGFAIAPLPALPTVLLSTTVAPMLVGLPASFTKRVPAALGTITVVAASLAVVVPKFGPALPQRANVVFREDDAKARVFVDTTWGPSTWGAAPAAMMQAIGGATQSEPALPWMSPSPFAEVPRVDLPSPEIEVLSAGDKDSRRHVRARVRSRRGASTFALVFPRGRHVEVKVEGRWASTRPVVDGSMLGIFAVPPEGVVVELESPVPGPIAVTLLDRTTGVPAGTKAAAAVRARPTEATPSQDGDVTVVTTVHSL